MKKCKFCKKTLCSDNKKRKLHPYCKQWLNHKIKYYKDYARYKNYDLQFQIDFLKRYLY